MSFLFSKITMNLLANIVVMLLILITIVHFSNAYFSYALILFSLFLLYDWIKRRKQQKPFTFYLQPIRPLLIAFVLFYGALLIDSLILLDKKSLLLGLDYASYLIPFFMFYFLRQQYQVDSGIKWGILIGGLIICISGFLIKDPRFIPRMNSLFAHPNSFGTVIYMLFPLTIYYSWRSKCFLERIYCLSLSLLLLFCLYRTESRGAMMSLCAATSITVLLLVSHYWNHLHRRNMVALILLGFITFSIGIGAVYQISSNRTGLGVIGGERAMMLESSYQMWTDHKLFGVGLANWEENYYSEAYHPKEGREQNLSMPHNMSVYFFSTSGIIGGLTYFILLVAFLLSLYKGVKTNNNPFFIATAMIVFLAFTIHGLVDATIISKIPSRIFYALMGYYLPMHLAKDINKTDKSI